MMKRSSTNHPAASIVAFMALSLLVCLPAQRLQANDEESFSPAEYDAQLNAEHFERAPGHDLTLQIIVSAEKDEESGKMVVWSFTQVLDCKRPEVLTVSRCDPCEYPVSEWVRRPKDVWFIEKSWHRDSSIRRARALRRIEHFRNYFFIEPMQGVEHRGMTHQFWRFDGRRPSPLEVRHPPAKEPPEGIDIDPPKEWDDIDAIEIRYGDSQPEEITTPVGERTVRLTARAYTKTEDGRRLTDDFWPFWSSECGTFSRPSGQDAKETVFRLSGDADECNVHLFEARTAKREKVVVRLGREPPPPVRVAITFEGGREADGVVLSGSGRWVDLEAHAYNPDGEQILGFTPDWGVDGGRVEYLNEARTKLRVHVDEGESRAIVRARHSESGAEDTFEIKVDD